MEFKFNVSEIFPGPIVEINQSLIPPGFTGDRRALWDVTTKVSEVVNSMGDASAAAQGLTKPITSADRLRNSEQTIYLLVDRNAKNGKGVVTGMLKTGKKSLYVFDRDGHHYQVSPPCVLDFYVHESRQRTGLGKQLFEHMLQMEKVEPVKMAVDRPSEKLLSFLDKHYGLHSALRQMNNYVVFDGFFPEKQNQDVNGDGSNSGSPNKTKQSANGLQPNFASPYGRYGAPRPPCSMGQIIHNQSPVQSNEPSGVSLNQNVHGVSQSTPPMQYQQQIYSNQGHADVCQSAPNVPYQQAQPVDPNMGQQNMQYYAESNGMPQQQQPNMYPCPNVQHQHIHQPHTHQSVTEQQYANMQNQQLNMEGQPVSMPHMHQHRNMQRYQQEDELQQPQPIIHYQSANNGISPREEEPQFRETRYLKDPYKTDHLRQQRHVASQPSMPVHQQHRPVQHMAQNISQPHFAQTASSYPAISTQYQPHQQVGASPAPQRGGGTGIHQHMITSPQHGAPYQERLTPHQTVPSQQTVASHHHVHSQQTVSPHSHHHVQSQQMVSPHQTLPSQHSAPSHHHVPSEQMVSSQQTVASQQNAHYQQMASPHQTVQSQQTVPSPYQQQTASSHHVHSQQMVSPQQTTPHQHTAHSHHHVHSQQMVQPQEMASPRQEQIQGQNQHYLHAAQPQSMPTVSPAQQQLPQMQSMPVLQPAQGNVQYQQYIQPPNTEQPVQIKPQYESAPQINITSGQSTPRVPYQYYDSSSATMQAVYSQPHASSSRTAQTSSAAGDMSLVQKSSDYHQGRQNIAGVTPDGQIVVNTPRAPVRPPRKLRDTVSSLLFDASSQMSTQRIQQQGKPLNGEPHKALDDSVRQSPKLERPRSLSIQRSEEAENLDKKISNDVKGEVHSEEPEKKSGDELDNIENDVEKVEIAERVPQLNAANSSEKNSVDGSDDSENRSKSPNPLTAQGFFDLKFYHSRLW